MSQNDEIIARLDRMETTLNALAEAVLPDEGEQSSVETENQLVEQLRTISETLLALNRRVSELEKRIPRQWAEHPDDKRQVAGSGRPSAV